jgi:amyloid beta precursor protein binding protein 1
MDNAYKAWLPYSIPEPVQKVLELKSPRDERADFWIVVRALSQFVRDCGKLPLAGALPDMTASTDMYIKLQEIYGSRAEGDFAAITAHVATICKELGVTRTIPAEYIKRFCQNAQYCEVFQFRTLEEEFRPCSPEDGGLDLACECCDEDSLIQWYLALRSAERFRQEHGHWPGALCGDSEAALAGDVATLTQMAAQVVESYKAEGASFDPKTIEEMVRYGGCELHVTSSVLGGIGAQEAVKLLTRQYSPLNNTLLYDGLHGKMQTLEL